MITGADGRDHSESTAGWRMHPIDHMQGDVYRMGCDMYLMGWDGSAWRVAAQSGTRRQRWVSSQHTVVDSLLTPVGEWSQIEGR